jgi:hypothetical protein
MAQLYLDYNASTPIDPEVVDVMRQLLVSDYGNPSSGHWAAAPAKAALDIARGQVAALLGCTPDEIVFTSGGSEANNLALKGLGGTAKDRPAHFITSMIEHPATLEPCRHLTRLGVTVTYVPVDGTGLVDPGDVRRAITRDTRLISVMHANNEVGRSRRSPTSTASASTRTPPNPSVRSQRVSTSWEPTCFRLLGTRSIPRKGSVRSTSGAVWRSNRSSMAPDTKGAVVLALRAHC